MATTHARAKEVAEFAATLSNETKVLLSRIEEFLRHNTALAIDWAGDPKPAFLNENVDGNLDGLHFTRLEMANAVNSLNQVKVLLTGGAPSQGDYIGNLEKLAKSDA